jgi:hypothetical protein
MGYITYSLASNSNGKLHSRLRFCIMQKSAAKDLHVGALPTVHMSIFLADGRICYTKRSNFHCRHTTAGSSGHAPFTFHLNIAICGYAILKSRD